MHRHADGRADASADANPRSQVQFDDSSTADASKPNV
jgi:hypothetical protein